MRGSLIFVVLLAGCAMNGSPRDRVSDDPAVRDAPRVVIVCILASCHYPHRKTVPAPAPE